MNDKAELKSMFEYGIEPLTKDKKVEDIIGLHRV